MKKLSPEKRNRITSLVVSVFKDLDVTGENAKRYKEELEAMSDEQFAKWVDSFRNEDVHFYLEVMPYHNEPTLEQIEKAARKVGVQLHQYVYFKHDGAKDDPVRTPVRVPCGYIHVRRLQQILYKKTSYSTDTTKRNQLTGQLSGADAVGRLADEEAYALKTVGADYVLKEMLGPRADNRDKRVGMYAAIDRDGYVQYGSLKGDLKNQPTLNYMDVLLTGAGLKSDLIDSTELLRVTADRPADGKRK